MKKLALLFALCVAVFALSLNELKSTMQAHLDKSYEVLAKFGEDKSKAANEMFKFFDPLFDYALMAKLSLSKHYDTLNAQQKKDFEKAFEIQLKTTFTKHLSLYQNQTITITKQEQKKDRVFLNSTMQVNGEQKNIIFKFYDKKGDWLVYDVDVAGVSIIQTYRYQFADLLEKENFSVLLEKLKAKNFEIKK